MSFDIAGRPVGPEHPPYVIAEMSANHLQDLDRARRLVVAAADAGADAVKMQHYTPDTITVRSSLPEFRVSGGTVWDGADLYELYAQAMTPWEWTEELMALAADHGIALFSSPFDDSAVDFLAGLGVPAFKIASFEIVDLPLIRYAASFGKPLVISTGMAGEDEIGAALDAAHEGGATDVALLRCNSGYPARNDEMDLAAIPAMAARFDVPIGLSDHTLGSTAAVAAVALGACVVEKHLILSRSDGGPDAEFSAEPAELAALVAAVHDAHEALGTPRFGPSPREEASIALRRSLRAVRPIGAGTVLTAADVRSVRPAGGLPPDAIGKVVGSVARRDLPVGAAIGWEDLERAPDR